ncbi:BrnA antitoxin family protein [Beijerinckia sp. L45]|uniref:BrnA antitoxin family protein n=1 Tax=Beijerinckia sp. L45 TaxID=1641855 RepID=UPI00131AFD5E|nr:BrnA antitoxin family protein [Beijerinckia sp. L45]
MACRRSAGGWLPMPKQRVTMRLDADVVAFYRATGAGWQSRINGLLRNAAKLKV